ncbi:MAG: MSHA biogenesis protein MshJ [Rhodoferax sp.]|jgi:MSHA biogenesis protein MshJ
MKSLIERALKSLDALSLRERLILFASVIAISLALFDTFWLSPAQTARQQLMQRFDTQHADLIQLQATLAGTAKPVSTRSDAVQNEMTAVTARLNAVNQSVTALLPAQADSTLLAQMLVHVLRRYDGLTLVSTTAIAAPEAARDKAALLQLKRQGVTLMVSGPYADLRRYVEMLEQVLPRARWGQMTLDSENSPTVLTLELFLVEAQS